MTRCSTAFNAADLAIDTVFSAGLGISLIYGFTSMFGIEATANYQEEAKNAKRTIPIATYDALFFVANFYILTSWSLSSAVGSANVSAIAAKDPGAFVFAIVEHYMRGSAAT